VTFRTITGSDWAHAIRAARIRTAGRYDRLKTQLFHNAKTPAGNQPAGEGRKTRTMSINNETASAVNPTITEGDVIAFLKAQHAALNLPAWASLSLRDSGFAAISGVSDCDAFVWVDGYGDDIAKAYAKFTAKLPPSGPALIAAKRAEAAKLALEADQMEAAL
jgi:hypothetical protein